MVQRYKFSIELKNSPPDLSGEPKKVEHRSLLNWWKYNRKLIRQGKLDEMRTELLMELGNSRINHR